MHFLLPILISLLLVPDLLHAHSPDERLATAWRLFHQGQFRAASDSGQALVRLGWENPDLYLLLGNSAFRRDQLGHAILWFERGRRLDPDREDLKANLLLARSRILQFLEPVPEIFFVTWWKNVRAWPFSRLIFSLMLTASLTSLGGFLLFGARRLSWRRLGLGTLCVGSLLTLATVAVIMDRNAFLTSHDTGVVVMGEAPAFDKPAMDKVPVLHITEGNMVTVLEHRSGMVLVRLPDGRDVWMSASAVEMI